MLQSPHEAGTPEFSKLRLDFLLMKIVERP
jgi:hypothetical protein